MDDDQYREPQKHPRYVVVGWVLFVLSFGMAVLSAERDWISDRVGIIWIALSGLIGVPESFWRHKWLGWFHVALCIVIFGMAFLF
jgi:hypothetical protein